ncbi:hypothetical protein [Nocardiopsis alba]|uniref:hypothetical protein n=1 Tax=Nocardiopsis alba TaxID=53437 RepID=UPI0033F7E818
MNAYAQIENDLLVLEKYVASTLRPWCDKNGYPFKARRKSLQSLSEKLESGRYRRWSDLDDLYACTVVVPTVSHESSVLEFLSSAFFNVETRTRNSTQKSPDVFRFDSTRFIGKVLVIPGVDLPEGIERIKFEVQVPTAFEYAWSVVTHDLVYKSDDYDWRKGRLAALLKANVEQIELIISGFQENVSVSPQSPHRESEAKREVATTFKRLIDSGFISEELTPASWSRFADNFYSLVGSYAKNKFSTPQKTSDLLRSLEAEISSSSNYQYLMSGSLFQLVLGLVANQRHSGANINKFTIVDSVELRDIHGISEVPNKFDFET